MTLLGFKTILHKKCRSSKNSESSRKFLGAGPMSTKMKTNFKKSDDITEILFKVALLNTTTLTLPLLK
jgi:hypothetical protein